MRPFGITILAGWLAISAGCDIFETRDPEPPNQSSATRVPPTKYEDVLTNLQFAVGEYHIENYLLCFADPSFKPFEFIPAQETRARFPSVFDGWSLESERRYFQNLGVPTGSSPSLALRDLSPVNIGSDSVIVNVNYTLFFPHRRSGVPQVVEGNMQVYLGLDSQRRLWSIYRWQDSRLTTDSTWSYLKAVFAGS